MLWLLILRISPFLQIFLNILAFPLPRHVFNFLFLAMRIFRSVKHRPYCKNHWSHLTQITQENLNERVPLDWARGWNRQLFAIDQWIAFYDWSNRSQERKQFYLRCFTLNFRTPLAVLRGTLEVLFDKPRTFESMNQNSNRRPKSNSKFDGRDDGAVFWIWLGWQIFQTPIYIAHRFTVSFGPQLWLRKLSKSMRGQIDFETILLYLLF